MTGAEQAAATRRGKPRLFTEEDEMPDEVNIDDLLEMDTDEERAKKLQGTLESCHNNTEVGVPFLSTGSCGMCMSAKGFHQRAAGEAERPPDRTCSPPDKSQQPEEHGPGSQSPTVTVMLESCREGWTVEELATASLTPLGWAGSMASATFTLLGRSPGPF